MAYTLLVPLGEPLAAHGLRDYLAELAAREDVQVLLLHVLPDLAEADPAQVEKKRAGAEALLRQAAEQLALPSASIRRLIRMGDVATEIIKCALLAGADLIALATHSHKGLGRLLAGSISETVMRRARCPTFICHAGHAAVRCPIRRILVPLDGSGHSAAILDAAADLARLHQAELILYHDDQGFLELETPETAIDFKADLESLRDRLAHAGLKARVETSRVGEPADEILQKVEQLDVDVVAMTTHGRRGVSRLVFGSTAESILRHGECPVLSLSTAPAQPGSQQA